MKTNIDFWSYLTQFFSEWEMFQKKIVEKIETTVLCSVTFFQKIVLFVRWKNIVEPDRPQMIIWCMHIACWIPKATNTYSEYVKLITFPLQQWLHERASLLRYTYIACLVELMHMPVYIRIYTHFILIMWL